MIKITIWINTKTNIKPTTNSIIIRTFFIRHMTKSLPNPILNIFNLLLPKRLNIIRSYLIIRIISRLSLFFTFTANDTYFRNWIFVFWKIVVIFSSFFFYNVVGKRLLGDGFSSSVFGFATGWSVVVVDSRDDLVEEEVVVGEDGGEFVFFSGLWEKEFFDFELSIKFLISIPQNLNLFITRQTAFDLKR